MHREITTMAQRQPATHRKPQTIRTEDPLVVNSVEKAFRILQAFSPGTPRLSLTELTTVTGLDKSAVQRFAHTLHRLGYLGRDPATRRYELSVKVLDLAACYVATSHLVQRALPYLQHLSRETDETVSLSILDGPSIVFVSRFLNRHLLHADVVVGTRLPAYCTAPGIAILSRLPREEAVLLLERSDRRPITPRTTWRLDQLLQKLDLCADRGYATAFGEYFHGDISIAAPVLDGAGLPAGAINVAVPEARFTPDEAESRFAPLVVAAARSISQSRRAPTP